MIYPIEPQYKVELLQRYLMQYAVHKGHCATKRNTSHDCDCGLYAAIAKAHAL